MAALLWVPSLALFGREMFTREAPKTLEDTASSGRLGIFLGLSKSAGRGCDTPA